MNKIVQIKNEFGTRPFFIYDLNGFSKHLKSLKTEGVRFWYATKANPLSSILREASLAGFSIDCASAGEFRQAIRAGVPPDQILLTGPSKPESLFKEALQAGITTYVLESLQQVRDLEWQASQFNQKVQALLRLQIEWKEGSSVLGGSAVTAFGLSHEAWLPLSVPELKFVQIRGVHSFQWGNILETARLKEIWSVTAHEGERLADALGFKLEILDLGGGLGIPYQGEKELSFESVQETLKELKRTLPETEIWMELGRYAIGPYGKYVTSVTDRKKVFGKELLILEGGVHHLIRPALVKEAFPVTTLNQNEKITSFELHGPLCTALDHLGSFSLANDLKVGDSLIFHQCGAYGFTESMPFFLCHDLPAEFTVKDDQIECLRTWQKPESWLV